MEKKKTATLQEIGVCENRVYLCNVNLTDTVF